MHRKWVAVAVVIIMGLLLNSRLMAAPLGTAFTYQGQLLQGGVPANGTCDLLAKLFDAPAGGTQVAAAQTVRVTVINGLLTTQLDFGSNAFTGQARWLEVGVRCGDGNVPFTDLAPRQQLTGAPYALYAPGDGCPAGSHRYGIWCVDDTVHAGITSHNTAMQTCHNEGKTLCPLTALQMCDIVEAGGDCATLTDAGESEHFWTSDVHFAASIYGSVLNNNVIYTGANNFFVVPEDDSPFTHKFFCCQLALKP